MSSKVIEYVKFIIASKGPLGLLVRMGMLLRRFDLRGRKMLRALDEIESLAKKYDYRPTVFIPAIVLMRHYKVLAGFCQEHIETGIHGYTHTTFEPLALDEQIDTIAKAKAVFSRLNVSAEGFRSPYLSHNGQTTEAIRQAGLSWESNGTALWKCYVEAFRTEGRQPSPEIVERLYRPLDAERNVIIPKLRNGLVLIPLSLPDDELIVDRLGINDVNEVEAIWKGMFEESCRRAEICVLLLHPERMSICGSAMEALLEEASRPQHATWITAMSDIAQWCREKASFTFECRKTEDGYLVEFDCTDRATILGRNIPTMAEQEPFYEDYHIVDGKEVLVTSSTCKPLIAVSPGCDESLSAFLQDEGFLHETARKSDDYALMLEGYESFTTEDERPLLERIAESRRPLLRYWRWPDRYKNAFTTTHDLDSVSLMDFLYRAIGK